jgi:hypothetical protein
MEMEMEMEMQMQMQMPQREEVSSKISSKAQTPKPPKPQKGGLSGTTFLDVLLTLFSFDTLTGLAYLGPKTAFSSAGKRPVLSSVHSRLRSRCSSGSQSAFNAFQSFLSTVLGVFFFFLFRDCVFK